MAATKLTTPVDTADIQRQMAQIRNEMHQEVQGAVRSAQSLTDWQAMVKSHPWISLSIASVAGYFLVPRRHAPTPTFVAMASPGPVTMPTAPAPQPSKGAWRFVGTAVGLLAPVAVRAAQNYVLGHVENFLAQNPLPAAAGRTDRGPAREPGQSGRQTASGRLREQA